ncbi:hypothetical protein Syun_004627 [Stephania yunnanensis]|uniref:Uncharacterized protein n=1 Tax=Stephania yunnanensis TaxID=152371 RepID=A0AAP0L5Z4_9MAGN
MRRGKIGFWLDLCMEWREGMSSGDGSGGGGVAVMRDDAVMAANFLKEFLSISSHMLVDLHAQLVKGER